MSFKSNGIIDFQTIKETPSSFDMITKTLSDGSVWGRIYWLKIDLSDTKNHYFLNKDDAISGANINRFSLLAYVDDFKSDSGVYEFMLTYPQLSTTAYNRWRQTGSPHSTSPGGYTQVSTSWTAHAGPLRYHESGSSFYDCDTAGTGTWYAALAQTGPWGSIGSGNQIPAADSSSQNEVELWARLDTLSKFARVLQNNGIHGREFIEF
jgi:hypothetical protein